jgi:hypothetical protein
MHVVMQKIPVGVNYYLLKLDTKNKRIVSTAYKQHELDDANRAYADLERQYSGTGDFDAVLVSV